MRKAERNYKKGVLEDIETVNTENPKAFWNFIKKLGPRKANKVPMQIKTNDSIVVEKSAVLEKWQHDFSNLYGAPEANEFDTEFYADKIGEKTILENSEIANEYLNNPITFEEVEKNN